MPAYVIAGNHVTDAATMREYAQLVPATLEPFGGRFVARGGQMEVVEGTWTTPRLVVIEFPSLEHARSWYHSDAYQAIIHGRSGQMAGTAVEVGEAVTGILHGGNVRAGARNRRKRWNRSAGGSWAQGASRLPSPRRWRRCPTLS